MVLIVKLREPQFSLKKAKRWMYEKPTRFGKSIRALKLEKMGGKNASGLP